MITAAKAQAATIEVTFDLLDHVVVTFESASPLGMGVKVEAGQVLMSSVEKSSPAAQIPVGTKVLRVNGQSCVGKQKGEVLEMVKEAKGAGTTLQVGFSVERV